MEYTILATPAFGEWLQALRDSRARTRIQARIDRFAFGNPGDVKPIVGGIWEMRIDYGPGYRVYFIRQQKRIVVLLAGGDKRTQRKDIEKAVELAKTYGS